ncbi:hypothetical protein BH09MYX1_BH09MYX1_32800 [soil metagenome]
MITLETLECPGCGANIPVPSPGTLSVRCTYCGHESQVVAPAPTPEPRFVPPPRPVRGPTIQPSYDPVSRPPPSSGTGWVVVVVALIVVAMLGVGLFAALRSAGVTGPDFQWREAPVTATINGDDVEDFIGSIASRSEKGFPTYVAAFDGATFKELWRAGPYGTAAHELKYVVVDKWVVITEPNAQAHVVDLATGKELAAVALSDKADELCVPASSKDSAWIKSVDEKGVTIDLTTLAAHAAPRPAGCAVASWDCRDVVSGIAGCTNGEAAPEVVGFSASFVLSEGNDSVAIGKRSPGTATPMAIGFDPKDKSIRWQKALVPAPTTAWATDLHAVDMLGGKLIAEYVASAGKAGRLTALDPKTGAILWDVAVPNTDSVAEASQVTITKTRVYLPHWTWLDVYDVKSGAHVATLGEW